MQRVHASMQRLPCRTVSQLQTLPKPALPHAPRTITAPPRGPLPVLQPQSQRQPAPEPLITSLERLGGGLAQCCPLVLLQLTAPDRAQAARLYLDVPDWLANFHPVDFLLNTPVLTLGLLVLVLRLLPHVLKVTVQMQLLLYQWLDCVAGNSRPCLGWTWHLAGSSCIYRHMSKGSVTGHALKPRRVLLLQLRSTVPAAVFTCP